MFELHVLSDSVIVDFYKLAGEYGRRRGISDENNLYIKEAEAQVHIHLNFSYCLDWVIKGYTEPKRPFHSRIALLISLEDYVDLGCLVYELIEIYKWYEDKCNELRDRLESGVTNPAA
jgi:hypothetical protein